MLLAVLMVEVACKDQALHALKNSRSVLERVMVSLEAQTAYALRVASWMLVVEHAHQHVLRGQQAHIQVQLQILGMEVAC